MEAGLLDAAPIWTNLKTFPWSEFCDRVDILSGGYPCQPFSAAGKRLGTEDPRHLWPFIAAGIVSMRPRVCFFENVEGHISLGLREVISELEGLGYKVAWGIFSAREVGAPHQRKRVFILAKREGEHGWRLPIGEKEEHSKLRGSGSSTAWPSRPGQPQHEWEPPRVVGNAKHDGSHQRGEESRGEITSSEQGRMQESEGGSSSMGYSEHDGLPTEPILRGDETTSNSRRTEEPQQTRQSSGADRPSDVSSLQGCTSGSESVGNSEGWSNGQQPTEQQGGDTSWRSGKESGAMGNSETWRRRESGDSISERQGHWAARPSGSNDELSQAEPTLGGGFDGATDWLGHAKLFVTSDNRTDELRLLGNGVVPATAERAFRTLLTELQ